MPSYIYRVEALCEFEFEVFASSEDDAFDLACARILTPRDFAEPTPHAIRESEVFLVAEERTVPHD